MLDNNTTITNQDYFMNTIDSVIEIDELIIENINATQPTFEITQSTFKMSDSTITNYNSSLSNTQLLRLSTSEFEIDNVTYSNSNVSFILSTYSTATINQIKLEQISSYEPVILFYSSDLSMTNSNLNNVSSNYGSIIRAQKSTISEINSLTITNTEQIALDFSNTNITEIYNLLIENSTVGLRMDNCNADIIINSNFKTCGTVYNIHGAAIYSQFSNFTLQDSTFDSNKANNGPAVTISCSTDYQWETTISNNTFTNNQATSRGGAIYYNMNRPQFSDNVYSNNSALYGQDVASYAVRIVNEVDDSNIINLNDVGSGIQYTKGIELSLVDYDNQRMVLDNESTIKITPSSANSTISGIDYAKVTAGVANFDELIFESKAGTSGKIYTLNSAAIDRDTVHVVTTDQEYQEVYSSSLNVSFRHCQPGEQEFSSGLCSVCSYGTYTLEWNSTECISCIDNAICTGGSVIVADIGYWRSTLNSTKMIEWPRQDSCNGGYVDLYDAPTSWATGYGGILCTEWVIENGTKYQPLSNFAWTKWPSFSMNVIRVIGVIILALLFLTGIIIVNIRKTKENNFSILLRIFTNYIQLLTASLAFNINLPSSFTGAFSSSDRLSAPQESFFSFDCFIEDYELKGFAPNNNLFKLFLFLLLPFLLMIFYFVVFGIYKLIIRVIKPNWNVDFRRYMVVSLVCIIFVFHPRMSFESLSLFQCQEIDDNKYGMRGNLYYEWYSTDHLIWIMAIAMPMILIWVVGIPVLAFVILFKNRGNLEKWAIQRYMLVIYQGLKPEVFYWEFLNTTRKIILLGTNVMLASFTPNYRILVGIGKCFMK
jgi:hypothetical protein